MRMMRPATLTSRMTHQQRMKSKMKNGATGGVDMLTIEFLKADVEPSVDVLLYVLREVGTGAIARGLETRVDG